MEKSVYDVGIIGAGFAGLACARAAARRGLRVLVVDRKFEPGDRMHTTGLLVKEAAERWEIPATLTQRVRGIRLYSPAISSARTAPTRGSRPSSGLAATRSSCLAWKRSTRASPASIPNVCIAFSTGAWRAATSAGWSPGYRAAGPSQGASVGGPYPGLIHVGLACRQPDRPQLDAFERKLARLFDFSGARRVGRRGGLIPVGGPVSPPAGRGVALIGDAAGLVSPLSAGGIHTALESGFLAAQALADHQLESGEDPGRVIARQHPRYVFKRALRILFDHGIPDRVFDAALTTRAFTALARSVYFHHRGLRSADGWRDLAQTLFRGHP